MPTPPSPMLAQNSPWKMENLEISPTNPVLCSTKIDGERLLCGPSGPWTRSGKPIPNYHLRNILSHPSVWGFDGEITCGPANDPLCRTITRSGVSRHFDEPDWYYHVFDRWDRQEGFSPSFCAELLARIESANAILGTCRIIPVLQTEVTSREDLILLADQALTNGYEGLILRRHNGAYRCTGAKEERCTWKDWTRGDGMLKLKDIGDGRGFDDLEAVVVGWEPWQINMNEIVRSPLGKAERSSAKAGQQDDWSRLGALTLRPIPAANHSFTETFKVGAAIAGVWNDEERRNLANKGYNNGLTGYKCIIRFLRTSLKNRPMQPRFVAWSDPSID